MPEIKIRERGRYYFTEEDLQRAEMDLQSTQNQINELVVALDYPED